MKWKALLFGFVLGIANFGTVLAGFSVGLSHVFGGPADKILVLLLLFGPFAAWCGYLSRRAWRTRGDGRPVLAKLLHGTAYVAAFLTGLAVTFLVLRGL